MTPDERQIGKVMELALGYQGGLNAFTKMAGLYGIELPDWRVHELVRAWRVAHSATKDFWKLTEEAARRAVATPGKAYTAGKLVFREHVVKGIERFPEAFDMLFVGANNGKLLIEV